jgi:sorbitol-specific phosphotransferase system component IIA
LLQCSVVVCLLLSAGAAFGQAAAGYSEYFLPGDEQNMYFIFNDLDANAGATGMHSVISVVAWSANTTVYYDHWENGYNFDPNNPAATADETYTLATPGTIKVFESSNVPNVRNSASTCAGQTNPGNRCYDGGDHIFIAGGPVTVTRAVWMEARGAGNQGDAWEIYPVKPQLTTYVLPFGEDNFVTSANFFTGFERVYALIQATEDNTHFTVDLNNDGVPDVLNLNRDATWNNAGDGTTVTLQKGETFLLDRVSACTLHTTCTTFPGGGPLNSGTVIQGDKTLQVKYVAGRINQTYAARGLSAFPRGFWTNDYYAPFGQAANANNGVTDYYLFNPGSTPLTINWQSQAASGSFAIPANSSQSYNRAIGVNPSVPVGSGLYFSATSPFWGVGFGDSTAQGNPTGQAFEWGFSLLPTTFLYKEHFMGWSPGSLPLTTAPVNGNGIFLTVGQDNTRVFVDYNNDGVPDQTYTLNRLQSQFVPAGPTGALDGARFWSTGLFSMAYGENADTATTPTPNLDLGYVALPGTDFVSLVLTTSKTANPTVVSTATGSTTDFTILVNSQAYSIDGVSVVDTMPPNWQYVPGFTTITKPDLTSTSSVAGAGTVTINGTTAVVGTGTAFNTMAVGAPITIAGVGYTIQTITDGTHITLTAAAPNLGAGQTYFRLGSGVEPTVTTRGAYLGTVSVTNGSTAVVGTGTTFTNFSAGDEFTINSGGVPSTYKIQSVTDNTHLVLTTTYTGATAAGLTYVGPYILTWSSAQTGGSMAANQQIKITFRAATRSVFAAGTLSENNILAAGTRTVGSSPAVSQTFTASDFTYVVSGSVQIAKSSSVPASTPLFPGDTFSYTTTVTNPASAGTNTLTGVSIYDSLPTGLSGVAGTTTLSRSTVGDSFNSQSYTLDVGTRTWTAGWAEGGDTGGGATNGSAVQGDIQISAAGELVMDNLNSNEPTISRAVSLTGATAARLTFRYHTGTGVVAGASFLVQTGTGGTGGAFATALTLTGITGATTGTVSLDISSAISATAAIRFVFANNAYNAANQTISIDDVSITYDVAVTGTNPPDVLSSSALYSLVGGQSISATFNVQVNNPFPTGQTSVTNTSSTSSVELPIQLLSNPVTNIIATPTVSTATVTGRVWLDANDNAVQDIGEPGIDNVIVTLKNQFGAPVATATTDSNGRYVFPGIAPGNGYYVEATSTGNPNGIPAGLTQSFPVGNTNNRTTVFNLTSGQNYSQADLGYTASAGTVSFGDQAWVDADGDGLRDPGEVGLGGVTVKLYRDTNGNGLLDLGVDLLVDTLVAGAGTVAATNGSTAVVGTGTTFTNLQNGDTISIAGVTYTVNTVTDNTHLNLTTTYAAATNAGLAYKVPTRTAPDGSYLFSGITPATGVEIYFVNARTPAGYTLTTPTPASPSTTYKFGSVSPGFAFLSADYGYLPNAGTTFSIKDRVFKDTVFSTGPGTVTATSGSAAVIGTATTTFENLNPGDTFQIAGTNYTILSVTDDTHLTLTTNYAQVTGAGKAYKASGIFDNTESGIAGVSVELLDASLNVIGTTLTAADGTFTFSGLTGSGADYTTQITDTAGVLTNFVASSSYAIAGQRLESNLVANIDRSASPSYGYKNTRSVGDTVFSDLNGNGFQDAGEPGIAGVVVRIAKDANLNGIIDLAAGTGNPGTVTATLNSTAVTGAGTTFLNLHAGEPFGIQGVEYIIQSIASNTSLTLTSNYLGATAAGKAYTANPQLAGTVTTTAGSAVVTGTGTAFTTDFKVNDTITIGGADYVVQSIASNTSLTLTTIPVTQAGVTYRSPVFFGSVTTDASGKYLLSGLANGSYVVSVQNPTGYNYIGTDVGTVTATINSTAVTGAGTQFTKLVAGETITIAGVTYTILSITNDTSLTLTSNYLQATGAGKAYGRPDSDATAPGAQLGATVTAAGNILDRDFAFQVPVVSQRAVTGKLWNDADKNGVIGGGESGLSGVTLGIVSITTGTGTLAVTNGTTAVVGTGTTFTAFSSGDIITIAGVPYTISSVTDNTHLTLSILYRGATASGLAFQRGGSAIQTVTTDANGLYSFTGLANSSYVVEVTDTNGNVVGFGATWEKTEGLTSGPNPANGMEVIDLSTSPGTVSTTNGSANVVGSGTTFVGNYRANDPILINGVQFIVQSVTDNTHLVLTTTASSTSGGLSLSSPPIDFGYALLSSIPTLIKLRLFDAPQNGKDVTLMWQTSYEADNLGFNVYRTVNGIRTKINKQIIGGSAFITKIHPVVGYSYRLHDTLPSSSSFAQYWLEDLDLHGKSTINGPYSTRLAPADPNQVGSDSPSLSKLAPSTPVLVPASGIGALQPTTLPVPTGAQIQQQRDLADGPALKISIANEGWYRLTAAAMTAAGFTPPADAKKFTLFCDGIEVPMVVNMSAGKTFGPSDSIEFYALGLDTPSTGSRTYWLKADSHSVKQLTTFKNGGGSPLTNGVPFIFKRTDRTVLAAEQVSTGEGTENFYGPIITTDPSTQDLTVANLDPAGGNATLDVVIRGAIDGIQHLTTVEFAGQLLGTAVLADFEEKTFTYSIPQSSLVNGANTLKVTALNGYNDVSLLVSATLTYQHLLKADNGLLEVQLPGSQQFTVDGFTSSSIRALDVTDPNLPIGLEVVVAPAGGGFKATFTTPASASPRIVSVFSSDRVMTPDPAALALNTPSSWSNPLGRQADLLILTHSAFKSAAATLKSVRDAGGTLTTIVDVEDIYDEYNFGIKSPQAIRTFLQSTATWTRPPKYVLLLGDASIDPRDYIGLGSVDYVPTWLVPTIYIKTPSDDWFTDFNNDGIGDLPVGRIPVKTAAEAALVIGKIASRTTPSAASSQKVLFVADSPDTFDFEGEAAVAKALMPGNFAVQTIDIATDPSPHANIVNGFNSGSLLVDYMGHGSVELWSFNLFNSNDAAALSNGTSLPFVMAMTCLNGYFHDVFTESLAAALMKSPNGGAVAVWASSTLTEPYPQFLMNRELLRQLVSTNQLTIGDAIKLAKQATTDINVRRSWILFGDPSMKLTH